MEIRTNDLILRTVTENDIEEISFAAKERQYEGDRTYS